MNIGRGKESMIRRVEEGKGGGERGEERGFVYYVTSNSAWYLEIKVGK